mmetsp:Transcript_22878/g.38277  ORF Transcript_22878/g.38277 Transcript_22878/m.38277 type:complete len:246 (-) Transcript_22878:2869-3606(-)
MPPPHPNGRGPPQAAFDLPCRRDRQSPSCRNRAPTTRSSPKHRYQDGCGPGSTAWRRQAVPRKYRSAKAPGPGRHALPHPTAGARPWSDRSKRGWARPDANGSTCDRLWHHAHALRQHGRGWPRGRPRALPGLPLFHRYRLGQIAWLVHIRAFGNGRVIGQQLRGHSIEDRGHNIGAGGHFDLLPYAVAGHGQPFGVRYQNHLAFARHHLLHVGHGLFEEGVFGGHDDHRHMFVDQRNRAMFQFT